MTIGINWGEVWKPVWKAVWTNVAPVAPVTSGLKPAGKSRKRRKKYTVEIDGEVYAVGSEAEAIEVLEKVAEKARETAELAISRAAKAKAKPARDVIRDAKKTLKAPEIEVSPDLDAIAAHILKGVQSVYSDALQSIEISTLLRKREREDEEDEDILLLLV